MAEGEKNGLVHYQISITGRQAAGFFLALLFALCLAFFFGMKTGAAARRSADAPVRSALVSEAPAPAREAESGASGVKVPTPAPAGDKLGFEAPTRSEPPAPPAVEKPTPEPTVKPTGAPAASTPAPTAAAAAKPSPRPAAAKKDGAYVQVLATQNATTADELSKKLAKAGFKADVSEIPNKAGWFRVRVGPYPDRARAQTAAKKLQQVEKSIKKPLITN